MTSVLVVDDMQAELQMLSAYLQQGGYSVMTAINGQQALDKIETQKPDIVITDLVMPEMNGLEFCRKLKKNPETAEIPVIACTTKDRSMDVKWAKKQGVDGYVVKPCTKAELLEAIQSVAG